MTPIVPKRLVRILADRRFVVSGTGALAAAVAPLALPLNAALLCSGPVVLFLVLLGCREAAALRRLRRDIAAKRSASVLLVRQHCRDGASAGESRRFARVQEALAGGFPESAVREADAVASLTAVPARSRFELLRSLSAWQLEGDRPPSETVRSEFDVVFISPFSMPGGNTSANAAEIRICRDQGLKIGLLHHPIYRWGPNAPINARIEALVDGESVRLIGLDEEVTCELAVVRLPTAMMKPLERRPRIAAGHTVVHVNQTPFKFYGPEGPREEAWDIATVERNLTEWLGDHTWYAGGPQVRATLLEHHADEIADLDLASSLWTETIDIDEWRLSGRRDPDGRIRIGRHTRDHRLKWPEHRETLLRCYPDREPFEIHVLGGGEAPTEVCGTLPGNWTVHPFNALSAKDFLARIDLMAYFIASDGVEAFGRAPLEAMAAGVPVIMDPWFEPTFGPAAVYCDPDEVASVAEELMADPDRYASQQSAAWSHLAGSFSGRSLTARLAVNARSGRFRRRLGYTPAGYWERRYKDGGDSGEGSRGEQGAYKARYVSDLIKERQVSSVIDWGCGDGQVLDKIDLHGASYLGVDVSEHIVRRMRARFASQPCYRFELPEDTDRGTSRDLALSMDVIFHFPVDADYDDYLSKLFGSADRFVLIYSTNFAGDRTARHMRRREFTADIAKRFPEWDLTRSEPPLEEGQASFFLYEKADIR